MPYRFSVFLIEPAKTVVYSFEDKQGKQIIYNAGSLEVCSPNGTGHSSVEGDVTAELGVQPMILGNERNEYQVVYAPLDSPFVYDHDGTPARHRGYKILNHSNILIPDIPKSIISINTSLTPVNLSPWSKESIQKYIELSHQGKEQETDLTYDEFKKLNSPQPPTEPAKLEDPAKLEEPLNLEDPAKLEEFAHNLMENTTPDNIPIVSVVQVDPLGPVQDQGKYEPTDSPTKEIRSPSPRNSSIQSSPIQNSDEISQLKAEVSELRELVRAMNQRLYRIYPINIPRELQVEGKPITIIDVDDIKKKIENKEIERFHLDPMLQAYAGSHRSNNRFLTYHGKDGNVYLVRAEYNPESNQINAPK